MTPSGPRSSPRARAAPAWTAWLPLAVALLAFAAYTPALVQGFVLGDDDYNLVLNERWRGLSPAHLRWMWTTGHLGHYQPLTWMSFGLEHVLFGDVSAQRMHAINMALHAGSAVLFLGVLTRLLRARHADLTPAEEGRLQGSAAAGALLYAVHPLRVESVAWATERRDVLAGFFLLATMLAWLRHLEGGDRRWLAWTLLLYTASLLSKAWGMTLPVVLLVLDFFPLRRWDGTARGLGHLVLEKWPFLPLALAGAVAAALAQAGDAATLSLEQHGALARCVQAAYGLGFYLRTSVWPLELSTLYLLRLPLDPTRPAYVASAAFVILVTLALVLLRKRMPALLAAWIAYIALVSPVLGFLQSGLQVVADRYSYLGALPLAALAAAGLFKIAQRAPRPWLAPGLAAALIGVLFLATWRQTLVWSDSVRLWGRAVEVEPDNYIARHNLASALHQARDLDGALEHARRSVELEPGTVNAYARFHLATVHLDRGDLEAALATWRQLLELDPAHALTREALKRELTARGRGAELEEILRAVLARRPDLLAVRDELARSALARGDRPAAAALWQESLQMDPGWIPALSGYGKTLLEQGKLVDAEAYLGRALERDPRELQALVSMGRLRAAQRRFPEAEALWRKALAVDANHAEAKRLLARLQAPGGG